MPTYDYRCNACDHEFELFQSMSDSVKKKCPECGKLKLERLIGTGAAVMFKGSGFYETDYRSEGYKNAEKADKEAAKASAETDSKSASDSKGTKDSSKPKDSKKTDSVSKASSEKIPSTKKQGSK